MKRLIVGAAVAAFIATAPAKAHNSISPECARMVLLAYDTLMANTDRMLARGFSSADETAEELSVRYTALLTEYTALLKATNDMIHACTP